MCPAVSADVAVHVGVVGVASCGVGLCVGSPLLQIASPLSSSSSWWQDGLLLLLAVVLVVLVVAGWKWARVRGCGGGV